MEKQQAVASVITAEDIKIIQKCKVTAHPHLGSRALQSGFLSRIGAQNRDVIKVSPALQSIISSFEDFEVLDEHVRKTWRKISFLQRARWLKSLMGDYMRFFGTLIVGPRFAERMLIDLCCELYQRGYLLSVESVRASMQRHPQEPSARPMTSVGFVTGNRVESLIRAVESYGKNCQDFGRSVRLVVSDDSRSVVVRNEYRQKLSELKRRFGFEITYIGFEEKLSFVTSLEEMGIDRKLLVFALLQEACPYPTYGKNRNALQLACAGEVFFSADDDTHCLLHQSKNYKPGVKFQNNVYEAHEILPYPSRENVLSAIPTLNKCFLDLHEKVLGHSLYNCVLRNHLDQQSFSLQGSLTDKINLLKGKGKVRTSFNGLLGDSGSGNITAHLYIDKKQKREILGSPQKFEQYSQQRNIYKGSECIKLIRADGCMTTFFGLDATDGSVPFFPFFRMEDNIFAKLNFICDPTGYSAYLPWELEHLPLENRIQPKVPQLPKVCFFPMHSIVTAALHRTVIMGREAAFLENVRGVGESILDFCRMDSEDIADLLLASCLEEKTLELIALESLLQKNFNFPRFWKNEVKLQIESLGEQVRSRIVLASPELLAIGTIEGAESMAQEYLRLFGNLLVEWPTILEATQNLKQKGITLGSVVT